MPCGLFSQSNCLFVIPIEQNANLGNRYCWFFRSPEWVAVGCDVCVCVWGGGGGGGEGEVKTVFNFTISRAALFAKGPGRNAVCSPKLKGVHSHNPP